MANGKAKTAAAPQPAPYKKSTLREYFESLCVAVILALFVRTFVVQAFKIPTGSMENNLLIGDHLLVNKMVFAPTLTRFERAILPNDPIERGDIIVFKYPVEPERDYIKRVIGLPGDTLELKNKTLYVNGKPLDEPVRALPVSRCRARQRRLHRPRRAPEVWAGHRARRPLLHDGRQPRQLAGQPILGVHAAELRERQGVVRLLLVRRREQRPLEQRPVESAPPSDSLALMKTIIKLLVAAVILNATARLGLSAWQQYQFRDSVQEMLLFGNSQTTAQLQEQIVEEAEEQGVPLAASDVIVERQGMLTTAETTYVDEIEVFPRYVYPMTWSFKVDARRIEGQ